MSQFNPTSLELNSLLTKKTRKDEGIFFTPKNARQIIIDKIDKQVEKGFEINNILEPSFGSGEFLDDVKKYNVNVIGVEKNETIFNQVKYKNYTLYNEDFLKFSCETKFDVIIGNPPYFVVDIKKKECMTGRGNIFVLFIYKCLTEHLNKNGLLAFVLPTSFYNCKYYEPCRRYIANNCTILYLENIDVNYYETDQNTMILIVKNKPSKHKKYILNFSDNLCFSPYYIEIQSLYSEAKTLEQLGFGVKTGEIVWNENKDKLDNEEGTLVIYSSNIVKNTLVLNNLKGEKKQYIKECSKQKSKGPAILVSRGYGNNYIFSYTKVEAGIEYYGENHINIIYPKTKESNVYIDVILRSFKDKRTANFIKWYVGNGAISKTEMETILPIFFRRRIRYCF
jgi:hypothetical protein